jgi:hypothetical protein
MRRSALVIGVVLMLAAGIVVADVAMPRDKWVPIRMASENVKIVLGPAKVTVEAAFVLENEKEAVTAVVGYPRGVLEKSLDDFAVTVDGEKAAVNSQKGASERDRMMGMGAAPAKPGEAQKHAYQFEGPYPEWKTFNVKFDAKQKRTVVIRYSVAPAEVETEKGKLLTYVYTMKTGATWSGNIGSAVIEATLDGVARGDIVTTTPTPAPLAASGATPRLVWQFKDFKPTQNIEITFKAPK